MQENGGTATMYCVCLINEKFQNNILQEYGTKVADRLHGMIGYALISSAAGPFTSL